MFGGAALDLVEAGHASHSGPRQGYKTTNSSVARSTSRRLGYSCRARKTLICCSGVWASGVVVITVQRPTGACKACRQLAPDSVFQSATTTHTHLGKRLDTATRCSSVHEAPSTKISPKHSARAPTDVSRASVSTRCASCSITLSVTLQIQLWLLVRAPSRPQPHARTFT